MAVAEASLRMVIDSMFCGLTIVRALVPPVLLWLVMGTPSITISGLLEAESEEPPRMRMLALPVGSPPLVVTVTPGLAPTRRSCADVDMPASTSSGVTIATDPVASDFFTEPYPITTVSASMVAFSFITMLR